MTSIEKRRVGSTNIAVDTLGFGCAPLGNLYHAVSDREAALEHGDWDCFLLAGRYTLLEQESLDTFLPKCTQRNCSIIVGGAYNSGILATGARSNAPPRYNYAQAPE